MEKRKKPKKKKLPRILVEWFCSECDQVHRISFPYSLKHLRERGQGIRVKWGARDSIKKLEIDYRTTLTDLNDFLNSVFSQKFKAKKYVKICYPKKLIDLLRRNETEFRFP